MTLCAMNIFLQQQSYVLPDLPVTLGYAHLLGLLFCGGGGGVSVILSMHCLCHMCSHIELYFSLLQVPSHWSYPAGPRFPRAGFLQPQNQMNTHTHINRVHLSGPGQSALPSWPLICPWTRKTGSSSTFKLPPSYATGSACLYPQFDVTIILVVTHLMRKPHGIFGRYRDLQLR